MATQPQNTVLCTYAKMNFSTHHLCTWIDINNIAPFLFCCWPGYLHLVIPCITLTSAFRLSTCLNFSFGFLFQHSISGHKKDKPQTLLWHWVNEMVCFSLTHNAWQPCFVSTWAAKWVLTVSNLCFVITPHPFVFKLWNFILTPLSICVCSMNPSYALVLLFVDEVAT